jgi:hypothetical protein
VERQSGPPGQIPYWALKPGAPLQVGYIFDDNVDDFVGVGTDVFKGGNCVECLDKKRGKCCGCTSMDIAFPYFRDIGACESCDRQDGLWPWSTFFVPGPARSLAGDDPDWHFKQGTPTEEDDDAALAVAQPRASGTATISQKKVSACGQRRWATERYQYPAFPANAQWPWDGIQNNRWEDISRYWHNVSASCSNWTVGKFSEPDYLYPAGVRVRANYQTEHVFEGQLIGDFFTLWLAQGAVAGGSPGTSKLSCAFTREWITKVKRDSEGHFPWLQGDSGTSFFQYLLQELGSENHMDRLTIYLARPNRKKGAIFSGNQPTAEDKWSGMDGDEQLQSVKEMGMTFSYMNHPDIVRAFCGTYEAIYEKLEFFRDYWDVEGDGDEIPDLQEEWKNYIRASLDAVVDRSSDTFWWMYANANELDHPLISGHWLENIAANVARIHLNDVTCDNLPGPSR